MANKTIFLLGILCFLGVAFAEIPEEELIDALERAIQNEGRSEELSDDTSFSCDELDDSLQCEQCVIQCSDVDDDVASTCLYTCLSQSEETRELKDLSGSRKRGFRFRRVRDAVRRIRVRLNFRRVFGK